MVSDHAQQCQNLTGRTGFCLLAKEFYLILNWLSYFTLDSGWTQIANSHVIYQVMRADYLDSEAFTLMGSASSNKLMTS